MRYRGFNPLLRRFAHGRHEPTFSILNQEAIRSCSSSIFVPGRILLNQTTHNRFFNLRQFSVVKKMQKGSGKRKYVPRKAAVELTDRARTFFKRLLEDTPEKAGIMLHYKQASSGQPRMVFSFGFVTAEDIVSEDEGVSLEVDANGDPVPPGEALEDGKPKLYINGGAFLKVLGATVDVDTESISPILYDLAGNRMDPNA